MPADAAARVESTTTTYLLCAAAWLVPGAGHLWLGRRQKGIVFLITLPLMYAIGLWLEGRIVPFDLGQPLVALAAFADVGIGTANAVARMTDAWRGDVIAITYEFGNAFIIVS